jgi:translation elongation factor P/translation initiation factor 5A
MIVRLREGTMKNIADNNLIRFINISKKKEGMFANFKAKGLRNGTVYSASFSVDLSAAEVDPGDSLEKIIEECARLAVSEIKRSEFQFEGLASI